MKKFLLVPTFLITISFQVNAQWNWQNPNYRYWLNDVYFLNTNLGWTVGDQGRVLKTTDGGTSWNLYNVGTTDISCSVFFVDTSSGYIVGDNGTIFHSIDGGKLWSHISSPTNMILNSIIFINQNVGWIVGWGGTILKTSDGGMSWLIQESGTTNILFDVFFVDTVTGWVTGENGTTLKTTNGGQSWGLQSGLGTATTGRSVYFIDNNVGWIVGYSSLNSHGVIYKTTNGGLEWFIKLDTRFVTFSSVSFLNPNSGWATGHGYYGELYYTSNGGTSWTSFAYNSGSLNSIYFLDSYNGWVVGSDGAILHTTNGGVTFIEDDENSFTQPKEFLLSQNYPNPFNPSTKISWQSPVSSWQTLKVYDILGNEVATLVNEEKLAGNYSTEFNASHLASGIYYYQLRAGDYVETKKMILLK